MFVFKGGIFVSIICAYKLRESIIMAADSKEIGIIESNGERFANNESVKIMAFEKYKLGIAFCNEVYLQKGTICDALDEFKDSRLTDCENIYTISKKLNEYSKFTFPNLIFLLGSFINNEPTVLQIGNGVISNPPGNLTYAGVEYAGEVFEQKRGQLAAMPDYDIPEAFISEVINHGNLFEDENKCGYPIDLLFVGKTQVRFIKRK
jgi:hypothetical protein